MDTPDKNISWAVFGSYEIKAWYYSPYVLDGLMRPEPTTSTPLRLNGGFSPGQLDNEDEQDVGEMTDSTDVDDSMQRILVPQVSSRMSTPAAILPELPRSTPIAGPSSGRPAGNRKGARVTQVNGKHTSRSLKGSEDASNGSTVSKTRKDKDKAIQPAVKLYVCEGCFKYMVHPASYALHFVSHFYGSLDGHNGASRIVQRSCKVKHPPGRKVYQKGAHTIWEVDGETQKLYCQNLCLFGKLFIDHKYVFFETSGFLFYVLTEGRPSFDHVFGFFSKEKISYNDYNLACIVTFPPYQKRGYGTLMIEFSYEMSSRSLFSRRAGTPERPLSDLGLRGYLQFWTSVLIRYFRLIFYTKNDPRLAVAPQTVTVIKSKHRKKLRGFEGEIQPDAEPDTSGAVPPQVPAPKVTTAADSTNAIPTGSQVTEATGSQVTEIIASTDEVAAASEAGPSETPQPTKQVSQPVERQKSEDRFEMQFSLAEIANATGLREDDVAFTLVHSGLANFRTPIPISQSSHDMMLEDSQNRVTPQEMQIVITNAIVEKIAAKFKVKPPVLSKLHCMI